MPSTRVDRVGTRGFNDGVGQDAQMFQHAQHAVSGRVSPWRDMEAPPPSSVVRAGMRAPGLSLKVSSHAAARTIADRPYGGAEDMHEFDELCCLSFRFAGADQTTGKIKQRVAPECGR